MKDTNTNQMLAIMRYELLMSWRRGSLRMIVIMMIMLPVIASFLVPLDYGISQVNVDIWPEDGILVHTGAAIGMSTFMIALTSFILPLVLSEVLPLDRQYRVRELLDTLPFRPSTYVAGKVLGFWVLTIIILTIMATVGGILAHQWYGAFSVSTLAIYWLTGPLLMSLFAIQMGIMLAAGRASRKEALLSGMLAALLSTGTYFILPVGEFLWKSLLATTLILFTTGRLSDSISFPNVFTPGYLIRIALVLITMVAVWAFTVRRIAIHRTTA